MVYITVLNYSTGEVTIHTINHNTEDKIDDYDEYLSDKLNYNLNDINYMVTDTLNLKII